MAETYRFTISNTLADIPGIHDQIGDFCARNHVSDDAAFSITLALEEVLTNVVSYAYEDARTHQISVTLACESGMIRAEVRDDGRAFDPLGAREPDLTLAAEDRPIGGLGVYLVKQLMHGVEYVRDGDENVLTFWRDA